MIAKLGILLLCALTLIGVALAYGGSKKPLAFTPRTIALCVAVAILALLYVYWKSRPS